MMMSDASIQSDSLTPTIKPTKSGNKSGTVKTERGRLTTVSSLCCLAFIMFMVDQLLMGHTEEAHSNQSRSLLYQAMKLWNYMRLNVSGLDCCCTVIPLALIAMQIVRRRWSSKAQEKSVRRQPQRPHASVMRREAKQGSPGRRPSPPSQPGGMAAKRPAVASAPTKLMQTNQAIDLAAREGDPKKAGRLLVQFEQQGDGQAGNWPDAVSFNLVIRAYAKKGDYQNAEYYLERMESIGIEATTCSYNTVLDACAKANHPEACEAWLEKMLSKGIEANVISYATVIYARAKRGEEAIAETWHRRMVEAGIDPDAVCYNSLIHACGVCGNPAGAERWMKEMEARGLVATVTSFTAVIDACSKGGDVPRAEKWLDAMISSQVRPNVVTFSAMIDACAKACNLERAEHWHGRMVECGVMPNAHSFSAVINACAKSGDVDKAEEWLGRFEEAGIANDVVVYSSVIDACGKVGDPERAQAIFDRMQANDIQPHIVAYAALARPYAYRGDYIQVERIASEMASCGIYPNEYFLYAQILSYATFRPRQAQRAEDCFREAMRDGLKANDHVVGVLVRAVGRERCEELLQELCNGRSIPVAPPRRDRNTAWKNQSKPLPRSHV